MAIVPFWFSADDMGWGGVFFIWKFDAFSKESSKQRNCWNRRLHYSHYIAFFQAISRKKDTFHKLNNDKFQLTMYMYVKNLVRSMKIDLSKKLHENFACNFLNVIHREETLKFMDLYHNRKQISERDKICQINESKVCREESFNLKIQVCEFS